MEAERHAKAMSCLLEEKVYCASWLQLARNATTDDRPCSVGKKSGRLRIVVFDIAQHRTGSFPRFSIRMVT